MQYDRLSEIDKKQIIEKLYTIENQSFADIAKKYNTYSNKIRRDAIKFKLKIRNKSEAQKNALNSGKHKHPTKGKKRSEKIKNKIGNSVLASWEKMSDTDLEKRKSKARKTWESKPENEKQEILSLANKAVREASKTGSKLEKFLLKSLIAGGYKVDFHKEQTLVNTKLQIDLFVPSIGTAIEVDGPSHFIPVWGKEVLEKNKKYDNKKEGLIIGKGWNLIRIKQHKDFSKTRGLIIYSELSRTLEDIKINQIKRASITIEDK
jgi:very-short-patch-repair endonuclease